MKVETKTEASLGEPPYVPPVANGMIDGNDEDKGRELLQEFLSLPLEQRKQLTNYTEKIIVGK